MTQWSIWDWVGRIGMYLTLSAVLHFAGWYGVALIVGILMTLIALHRLRIQEARTKEKA